MASTAKHLAVSLALVALIALASPVKGQQSGANVEIEFTAAAGPVPVGGYLQITTLLHINSSFPSNGTFNLTVTCSDAFPLLASATVSSAGCTNPVSVPPYPVGTVVGGKYPGCDSTPLGLTNFATTAPTYPTRVLTTQNTAMWQNVILSANASAPSALPVIGLVNAYSDVLCVATVTPSASDVNSTILNSVVGYNGRVKGYVKESLLIVRGSGTILPPPPPPPGAPPATPAPVSGSSQTTNVIFVPVAPNQPACTPGTNTNTVTSNSTNAVGNTTVCMTITRQTVTNTTTCVTGGKNILVNTTTVNEVTCVPVGPSPSPTGAAPVNNTPIAAPTPSPTSSVVIFVPVGPNQPPCVPGTTSNTTFSNSTAAATGCTTVTRQTVTNTTTCVTGGKNILVNTTTVSTVTCTSVSPTPVSNGTVPNGTIPTNRTSPTNGTILPNGTVPLTNGTIANRTIPIPNNGSLPLPTNATRLLPVNGTVPLMNGTATPTPTASRNATTAPTPTTAAPVATTAAPVATTAAPAATTAAPVATTAAPVATTAAPVATTAAPGATTAGPAATKPGEIIESLPVPKP